jgi:hypothetical protein
MSVLHQLDLLHQQHWVARCQADSHIARCLLDLYIGVVHMDEQPRCQVAEVLVIHATSLRGKKKKDSESLYSRCTALLPPGIGCPFSFGGLNLLQMLRSDSTLPSWASFGRTLDCKGGIPGSHDRPGFETNRI